MSVIELLRRSELFADLDPDQIGQIAALSQTQSYKSGDVIIQEGEPSDEIYIVCTGMVEVIVPQVSIPDVPGASDLSSIVRLGQGQVFGEMSLVDRGARSATVRCVDDDTTLYCIPREDLWRLCDGDHHIGYALMRNIASDLSFKLRHRNLQAGLRGGGA